MLAKLSLCHTEALGQRWFQCDDCDELTKLNNSCGDRNCPQCSGAKRQEFTEQAETLLLDGVEYHQVVFTLPEELSAMALGNRKDIADLLMHSAWKAIKKSVESEQGYEFGALMVLHTWNQKLESHWHVHALVPAAGPSLEDGYWKAAEHPEAARFIEEGKCPPKYLVDAINLRTNFRKFAINRLRSLRRRGKLSLGASQEHLRCDDAWEELINDFENKDWCVHIEPPRSDESRAEHVVRYLTRYLTGGPISDWRITHADDETVTILAREGTRTGGERKQVPYTMKTEEFVRRWCLHIQPPQLTKTRRYGSWINKGKSAYRELCLVSLESAGLNTAKLCLESNRPTDDSSPEPPDRFDDIVCEHCGSDRVRFVKKTAKPSWKRLLGTGSPHIPDWYRESRESDERSEWDCVMGEGYSDWYDENIKPLIEVAREIRRDGLPPVARQEPHLPLFGDDPGELTAAICKYEFVSF